MGEFGPNCQKDETLEVRGPKIFARQLGRERYVRLQQVQKGEQTEGAEVFQLSHRFWSFKQPGFLQELGDLSGFNSNSNFNFNPHSRKSISIWGEATCNRFECRRWKSEGNPVGISQPTAKQDEQAAVAKSEDRDPGAGDRNVDER